MRRTYRPSFTTSTDARAAGWIVSLLLHGTLAFGVFVFAQQITTRSQPVSFTWNVAMVTPPTPATPAAAASTQRSAPLAPASKPPVTSAPPNTMAPAQTAEPLTPTLDTREPSPLAPTPLEERIPHRSAEHPPLPKATEMMEHDSGQADVTPHTAAISAPLQSIASASADSVLSTHDESIDVPKDPLPPQQAALSTRPQAAALSPTGQAKSAMTDFGWLTDDVARWYEHFNKFYPPELRLEGIEGRVRLSMLIGKDGVVSAIRIAESSGNPRLDQAAVEIVSKVPPIKLSRPLGVPSKRVTFWYAFKFESAR